MTNLPLAIITHVLYEHDNRIIVNRKVNKNDTKCTSNIQLSFILYNSYPNSVKIHSTQKRKPLYAILPEETFKLPKV